jgi:hypothetical protein
MGHADPADAGVEPFGGKIDGEGGLVFVAEPAVVEANLRGLVSSLLMTTRGASPPRPLPFTGKS